MLRAKQSFMVGDRRIIHSGDLVHPDDPVVRGREALFTPVDGAPTNTPPKRASRSSGTDPAEEAAKKAAAAAEKAAKKAAAEADKAAKKAAADAKKAAKKAESETGKD